MQICLLGSQGTGKTSLLNLFRDKYKIIDGIARKVISEGGDSNQSGSYESQKRIFEDYEQALMTQEDYISTRSMIDVCAYTTYLRDHSSDDRLKWLVYTQTNHVYSWLIENPDIVICYVPVEFEPEDDGVRSVDRDYQSEIDRLMKKIFDSCPAKYKYTIKGTLEQRKVQLEHIIRAHG